MCRSSAVDYLSMSFC